MRRVVHDQLLQSTQQRHVGIKFKVAQSLKSGVSYLPVELLGERFEVGHHVGIVDVECRVLWVSKAERQQTVVAVDTAHGSEVVRTPLHRSIHRRVVFDGQSLARFVETQAQVVHHTFATAELTIHIAAALLQEVLHELDFVAVGLCKVAGVGITHGISVVEVLAPLPPIVGIAAEDVAGLQPVVAHRLVHGGQVIAPALPYEVD